MWLRLIMRQRAGVCLLALLAALNIIAAEVPVCIEFGAKGQIWNSPETQRFGLTPGPETLVGVLQYFPAGATSALASKAPDELFSNYSITARDSTTCALRVGSQPLYPIFLLSGAGIQTIQKSTNRLFGEGEVSRYLGEGEWSYMVPITARTDLNLIQLALERTVLRISLRASDMTGLEETPATVPRFAAFFDNKVSIGPEGSDRIFSGELVIFRECTPLSSSGSPPKPTDLGSRVSTDRPVKVIPENSVDPVPITASLPPGVKAQSVNLVRYVDPEGKNTNTISAMTDDGVAPDSVAGDNVFSGAIKRSDVGPEGTALLGAAVALNGDSPAVVPLALLQIQPAQSCSEFLLDVSKQVTGGSPDVMTRVFARSEDAEYIAGLDTSTRQKLAQAFATATLQSESANGCRFEMRVGTNGGNHAIEARVDRSFDGRWRVTSW